MQDRSRRNWCRFFSVAGAVTVVGGCVGGVAWLANKTGSMCRASAKSLIDSAKGFDLNFQNESISVLIPKLDPKNALDLTVKKFDYELGKKLNVAPLEGAASTICTIAEAGTWVVSYLTLSNLALSIWACRTARAKAQEQVQDFDESLMEPAASTDYGLTRIPIKRGAAAAGGSFTRLGSDSPSPSSHGVRPARPFS